jgi:uncharacterized circularly permuted ATP-grasp superfamily protein/uncharacterized alpha-E superfamily protein
MSLNRLKSYSPDARRYDELCDANGNVRAQWQPLIDKLTAEWPESARRSAELARRLVIENGVTYNVYADPQGRDRPWALDPIPLVITADEWQQIELGVAQRARVLDAMLRDLYGEQRLLSSGVVPPELAFGHPNFLWPCRNVLPAQNGRHLHLYAADLARAPDGRWWVLADRTQTPSGVGYALENQQIIMRVFPELMREMGVQTTHAPLGALREELLNFAANDPAPLAVVLTPGPFNETYFEHVYLARQLGLPLVEGHDLTVRGAIVYLKTLSGLRRVHSILRRLDDDYCDPLELRSDSALGVPGLLDAVRAGNVMVANALGSGVLESAAWLGFVPGAAEHLLGERLQLQSLATWWCGERPALDYVLENFERLVIKPAFPNQRFEPQFGRELQWKERADLLQRIRRRPYAYVAQERVALSQVPVWRSGAAPGFNAKSLTMRVYAMATSEGSTPSEIATGYSVMRGGLVRIAGETADVVSAQRGGGSKSVWILGSPKTSPDSLASANKDLHPSQPRSTSRHNELPSSLVENLFWLGRYAERCEAKTRLLRATLSVRTDPQAWSAVLDYCLEAGVMNSRVQADLGAFDATNPQSVAADLQRLGWSATQVRSRLSAEHWRAVSGVQRQLSDATPRTDVRETLDRLLLSLAAMAGFALDDMAQDEGWCWLALGRRLERLLFLSDLLVNRLASETLLWRNELEWILDINGCTIAYRTRYVATPRLPTVLDLLINDPNNPRTLTFQWESMRTTLGRLATVLEGAGEETLQSEMAELTAVDFNAIEGNSPAATAARKILIERLQALSFAARGLSDRLSLRYFSHIDSELRAVAS